MSNRKSIALLSVLACLLVCSPASAEQGVTGRVAPQSTTTVPISSSTTTVDVSSTTTVDVSSTTTVDVSSTTTIAVSSTTTVAVSSTTTVAVSTTTIAAPKSTTTTAAASSTTTTATGNPCPAEKVLGEDSPHLQTLRDFRDSKLAHSVLGRRVIQIYYSNADSIDTALDNSPALQDCARTILESLAPLLEKK